MSEKIVQNLECLGLSYFIRKCKVDEIKRQTKTWVLGQLHEVMNWLKISSSGQTDFSLY